MGSSSFSLNGLLGVFHVAAHVAAGQVHVHVAGEHSVLVAEHGRAGDELDVGQFRQRDLRAGHRGHQHAAELRQVFAEVAGVADVDRVALAALRPSSRRLRRPRPTATTISASLIVRP